MRQLRLPALHAPSTIRRAPCTRRGALSSGGPSYGRHALPKCCQIVWPYVSQPPVQSTLKRDLRHFLARRQRVDRAPHECVAHPCRRVDTSRSRATRLSRPRARRVSRSCATRSEACAADAAARAATASARTNLICKSAFYPLLGTVDPCPAADEPSVRSPCARALGRPRRTRAAHSRTCTRPRRPSSSRGTRRASRSRRTRRARRSSPIASRRQDAPRARLGRDQRDVADTPGAARSSSSSTTRAAGQVPQALLEELHGLLRPLRRAGDPGHGRRAARRRTARTGPRRAGAQPLPNLGFTPWTSDCSAQWLEVSHWTGTSRRSRPARTGSTAAASRRSSGGSPTTASRCTASGRRASARRPTASAASSTSTRSTRSYGPGWKRENSFVPHNPTGVFCYGFYSFDPTKGGYKHPAGYTAKRGPGTGEKYRITASGPGVTPNVGVIVPGLHPFDASNAEDVR